MALHCFAILRCPRCPHPNPPILLVRMPPPTLPQAAAVPPPGAAPLSGLPGAAAPQAPSPAPPPLGQLPALLSHSRKAGLLATLTRLNNHDTQRIASLELSNFIEGLKVGVLCARMCACVHCCARACVHVCVCGGGWVGGFECVGLCVVLLLGLIRVLALGVAG